MNQSLSPESGLQDFLEVLNIMRRSQASCNASLWQLLNDLRQRVDALVADKRSEQSAIPDLAKLSEAPNGFDLHHC